MKVLKAATESALGESSLGKRALEESTFEQSSLHRSALDHSALDQSTSEESTLGCMASNEKGAATQHPMRAQCLLSHGVPYKRVRELIFKILRQGKL